MEVGAQKTAVKSPVNGMACLLAAVDFFQDNAKIDDASNGSIFSCHMKCENTPKLWGINMFSLQILIPKKNKQILSRKPTLGKKKMGSMIAHPC